MSLIITSWFAVIGVFVCSFIDSCIWQLIFLPTCPLVHSFILSFIHSGSHSIIYPCIYAFIDACMHCSFIVHLLIDVFFSWNSCTHLLIHSFNASFVREFISLIMYQPGFSKFGCFGCGDEIVAKSWRTNWLSPRPFHLFPQEKLTRCFLSIVWFKWRVHSASSALVHDSLVLDYLAVSSSPKDDTTTIAVVAGVLGFAALFLVVAVVIILCKPHRTPNVTGATITLLVRSNDPGPSWNGIQWIYNFLGFGPRSSR